MKALVAEAELELNAIRLNVRKQIELAGDFHAVSDERFMMGNGVLELGPATAVSLPGPHFPDRDAEEDYRFARSAWEVIASAKLEIQQRNYDRRGPRGVRHWWVSSLYFARPPSSPEFRWWEIAFYSLAAAPEHRCTGFLSPEDKDADIALTGQLYVQQVAFGPIPIDGEDEGLARSRWLWLLSRAAISALGSDAPPIPVPEGFFATILQIAGFHIS